MEKLNLKSGISLLNSKNLIFIDYLINLNLYLLQKSQGENLNKDLVTEMIREKLLIQKLKPVENKLEYQINKLLRISLEQNVKKLEKKVK